MIDVTEQIKERINVADLIGEYLKLERAGSNYKALCPFHNEKTPSFMVNPERNFWYCFGCQKGGDIFSFIQEIEGIGFREALEKLAEKAGVEIPRFQKIDKDKKSQKEKIYEILEIATRYYQQQLTNHPVGKQVIEYLKKRKITGEQARDFRIGYVPEGWETILKLLLAKNYNLTEINASGLLVEKENGAGYYDRFRNRIMFPIIDINGRVIGFSARALPGQDKEGAKYINTPQTLVYDKSQTLYGIYQARTEIRKNNFVILAEGNMDVVASFSAGISNCVAISGTALTVQQINILKRYTDNFKFCFDMDEAGQRATKKSIRACLKENINLEIITLPEGLKDVNDTVIQDILLWRQAIEKSTPVMDYYFYNILKKYSLEEAVDRKKIAQELLNIIKDLADPVEKNFWLKKLAEELEVEEEVLTQVLEKVKLEERKEYSEKEPIEENNQKEKIKIKNRSNALQERLLGVLSIYLDYLGEEIKKTDQDLMSSEYKEYFNKIINREINDMRNEINQFEILVKYGYDPNEGFFENEIDPHREWQSIVEELKKEKKRELLNKIAFDIKKAERDGDEEAMKLLTEEFSKLCESKENN